MILDGLARTRLNGDSRLVATVPSSRQQLRSISRPIRAPIAPPMIAPVVPLPPRRP